MLEKETLQVVVNATELREMFVKAAAVHTAKAKLFRDYAAKMSTEKPDDAEMALALEGTTLSPSYGKSIASNVDETRKGLIVQARDHEKFAREREFVAAHLADGDHVIAPNELRAWGVL